MCARYVCISICVGKLVLSTGKMTKSEVLAAASAAVTQTLHLHIQCVVINLHTNRDWANKRMNGLASLNTMPSNMQCENVLQLMRQMAEEHIACASVCIH